MLTDSGQTFGVSECQTLDLPLAGLASPRSLTLMSLGQILVSMLLLLLGFDGGLPGLYGILRVANQCCITHFQIAQVNIRVWYIYNIFLTCVLLRNTWLVTTGEAIILSNTISGRAYIAAAFRSVCVTSFALCQAFRSGFSNLNKSAQRRHVIMSHFKDTSTNNVHKTSKNWESKRFPKVERKCVRKGQYVSISHQITVLNTRDSTSPEMQPRSASSHWMQHIPDHPWGAWQFWHFLVVRQPDSRLAFRKGKPLALFRLKCRKVEYIRLIISILDRHIIRIYPYTVYIYNIDTNSNCILLHLCSTYLFSTCRCLKLTHISSTNIVPPTWLYDVIRNPNILGICP